MLRYVIVLLVVSASAEQSAYQAAIAKWRQQKEAALRADGGWLTVSGLFWLKEGQNRVEPAHGVFNLHGGKTIFHGDDGSTVEMKVIHAAVS